MTVDIAQQDGANIAGDLNRRDYTLNEIAYDLQTGETIDPLKLYGHEWSQYQHSQHQHTEIKQ